MKTVMYLLAAAGLMFLGALLKESMEVSYHTVIPAEERVAVRADHPPRASEAIELPALPGSDPNTVISPPVTLIPKSADRQVLQIAPLQGTVAELGPSHHYLAHLVVLGVVAIVASVFTLGVLLGLKRLLHGPDARFGDGGGEIQALYQLGRGLESRMEALETILLERGQRGR